MNRLDQFVKNKLEERQFEFNEAHWLQAAEMIDAQKERRRRFFWLWFFGGQVLLLGLAFILWPASTFVHTSVETQAHNAFESAVPDKVKTNAVIDDNTPVIEKDPAQLTTPETPVQKLQLINADPVAQITPAKKAPAPLNLLENQNKEDVFTTGEATSEKPDIEAPVLGKDDKNPINEKALDINSRAVDLLPIMTFTLSERTRNSGLLVNTNPNAAFFSHRFSLVAASTIYPYAGTSEKKVIGYAAGLNFTKSLNRSWNLETGIRYRNRTGTFGETSGSQQTTYAFSRSVESFFLEPERLHFIEIPLGIQLMKNRHIVTLGITGSYLLGLQGSLKKEVYGESFPGTNTPELISRGWIANDQFKTLHWDVFASWYFALNTEMSLGVKINYTPGSILTSADSGFYLESKPVFFEIGLRYNLFNK